jgi:hypothetical protein
VFPGTPTAKGSVAFKAMVEFRQYMMSGVKIYVKQLFV